MKTSLLVLCPVVPANLESLKQRYDVTYAPTPDERQAAIAAHASRFQAVLTIGTIGLTAAETVSYTHLTLPTKA